MTRIEAINRVNELAPKWQTYALRHAMLSRTEPPEVRAEARYRLGIIVTERCRDRVRDYFDGLTRAGVALSLAGAPVSYRDPLFAQLGRLERHRA